MNAKLTIVNLTDFLADLEKLRQGKAAVEALEQHIFDQVRQMHAEGMSYATIGAAAGWPKEWVRRIVTGQTRRTG